MPTLRFLLQGYSYNFIYSLFAFCLCMHTCIMACVWQPKDNLWESVFLLPCGSQVYQSWHQTPVSAEAILPRSTFDFFLFSFLRVQVTAIVLTED